MIANDVEQERRKMFRRTDSVTGVFKTFPWEDYQIFFSCWLSILISQAYSGTGILENCNDGQPKKDTKLQ